MSDEAAWIDRARAEVARAEFWRLMEGVSVRTLHETMRRLDVDWERCCEADANDAHR